jgi:hypothetical protein
MVGENPRPPVPSATSDPAVETAWKIHTAIVDWTGKVDTKASFVLSIEAAVIAGVVTLSANERPLSDLNTVAELWWYRGGIIVLALAVLSVVTVVVPRLRVRKMKKETPDNYVYFGHLRKWRATDLAVALQTRPLLPVLTHQIVVMSKVAWTKHRRVQLSMFLAAFGSICFTVAGYLHG